MRRFIFAFSFVLSLCCLGSGVFADPKKGKLPHVEFDVENRVVRVECEALNVEAPLEFFCCVTGTNEHESVLRTPAKPSDIQIALLAIGMKPGQPLRYSEALNKWLPPEGPPLHMTVEYEKDGKTVSYPAYRWLRNVKTKKSPAAFSWVYTGSRVMSDGKFAADITGYVVSIVNFDLTLIDVPALASSANETLEWERNADLMPKTGTRVWMVLEPVGGNESKEAPAAKDSPTTPRSRTPDSSGSVRLASESFTARIGQCADAPAAPATATSDPHLSDVHLDPEKIDALEKYWQQRVSPHAKALREAAEAHYKVMSDLRREQQRLIEEADRIQRAIDKLEKEYQDMTTPRPEPGGQ